MRMTKRINNRLFLGDNYSILAADSIYSHPASIDPRDLLILMSEDFAGQDVATVCDGFGGLASYMGFRQAKSVDIYDCQRGNSGVVPQIKSAYPRTDFRRYVSTFRAIQQSNKYHAIVVGSKWHGFEPGRDRDYEAMWRAIIDSIKPGGRIIVFNESRYGYCNEINAMRGAWVPTPDYFKKWLKGLKPDLDIESAGCSAYTAFRISVGVDQTVNVDEQAEPEQKKPDAAARKRRESIEETVRIFIGTIGSDVDFNLDDIMDYRVNRGLSRRGAKKAAGLLKKACSHGDIVEVEQGIYRRA